MEQVRILWTVEQDIFWVSSFAGGRRKHPYHHYRSQRHGFPEDVHGSGTAAGGDIFYLHVLDETLAYEVRAIHTVLPHDTTYLGN